MARTTNLSEARERARQDLDERKARIAQLIEKRSDAAFKSLLVDSLASAPSINWKALAKRDPFKFVQSLEKLALMSGYVFDGLSNGPTVVVVEGMADNDLVRALAAARAKTSSLPLTLTASPDPSTDGIYKVCPEPKQQVCQPLNPVPEASSVPAEQPSETTVSSSRSLDGGGTGSEV